MSGAVALRGHIPAAWSPRPVSAGLADALYYAERGDDPPFPLPLAIMAEAETARTAVERGCRPVGAPTVMAWLALLNLTLGHPIEEQEFGMRAREIAAVFADHPAAVFTLETRAMAARAFKFLPGAAEVSALLEPKVAEVRRSRRLLRRLSGYRPPPPPARPAGLHAGG